MLINRLVGTAKEGSFSRLVLEPNVLWIEVIEFYRSCGFVEYPREKVNLHMALALKLVCNVTIAGIPELFGIAYLG